MLDKDSTKILKSNVLERINKLYPPDNDSSLANVISQIATQVSIITLQEYEKLNSSNID